MATGIEQYLAQDMSPDIAGAYSSGIAAKQQRKARELNYAQSLAKYEEWRADAETRRKQRTMNEKTLDFQLENLDERLESKLATERIQVSDAMEGKIAREVDQINFDDPESYRESMGKLTELGIVPEYLMTPEGEFLSPEDAEPKLNKIKNAAIDSVAHQRNLELARLRGQNKGLPSWAATEPGTMRRLAAIDNTESFLKKGVTDNEGDPITLDLDDSGTRFLENTLAMTTNMVARREADRTGAAPNEMGIQQAILNIAKKYIHRKGKPDRTVAQVLQAEDLPMNLPIRQEWDLSETARAKFLSDLEATFDLTPGMVGKIGNLELTPQEATGDNPRERAKDRRQEGWKRMKDKETGQEAWVSPDGEIELIND